MKRAAVERDGAGELIQRHEAGHKRRAGRPQKSPRRAEDNQAEVNPEYRRGKIGNQSEANARRRQHERRDEDDFFPAERVGEMSGGNRAKNHRNHQRQADERQRQRRVRPLVKLPVNRHDEHLLAERRDEAPDEVAGKIRVPQNGVGAVLGGGLGRRLVRQIFR